VIVSRDFRAGALYLGVGVALAMLWAVRAHRPARQARIGRTPSLRCLLGAVAALVVGDEVVGLAGTYFAGNLVDVTWMLSSVLFAAGALHPSMREPSNPRRLPALRVSVLRIALLGCALLTAPAVLVFQQVRGRRLNLYEVAGLAAGVAVVVVLGLTGILRALERLRLRERTARSPAEEAQQQLTVQNDELVQADRLKDEFVALISHDLRTPLTSIVGYVEPPHDAERHGYVNVVARSSERLLHLVDDLLFAARPRTGRLAIEPVEVDFAEIAARAVDEARPNAEQKGLTSPTSATHA